MKNFRTFLKNYLQIEKRKKIKRFKFEYVSYGTNVDS